MGFNDGDFVKIEYSTWRASDNKLVFTTDAELAKKNDIFDEKRRYGPELVVVGKSQIIAGLDNAVKQMSVNEKKRIELEAKDAFGERDQNLVRVMPMSEFNRRDIKPYPGMRLDLDGAVATVKSVTSGRVMIDANHPLAGEKLIWEIKVTEKVDKDQDRVKALAESHSLEPDAIEVKDGVANVRFGAKKEKGAEYFVHKESFIAEAMARLDGVSKIVVLEEYEKQKKEEPKKKAETKEAKTEK